MSTHGLLGQQLGGYLLEEELGRGSSGVVYRGKQVTLGRDVAIKVLLSSLSHDPSSVARFVREAQIVAGLNHRNIVCIHDAGQERGQLYFVMEYIVGLTVRNLLSLDGFIPQHLAAEYIAQAAEALDSAYQEGHVIHRDIKPENLMLDCRGGIKVLDFGLAHIYGSQPITQARALANNFAYAPPEQLDGIPQDHRSDIYALGVVLYEMLTGRHPYMSRQPQVLAQEIQEGRPPLPRHLNPELAPELERIILTAMAPNRSHRYAQARQMAADLRACRNQVLTGEDILRKQDASISNRFPEKEHVSQANPPEEQAPRPYVPLIAGVLTLPMRQPENVFAPTQ